MFCSPLYSQYLGLYPAQRSHFLKIDWMNKGLSTVSLYSEISRYSGFQKFGEWVKESLSWDLRGQFRFYFERQHSRVNKKVKPDSRTPKLKFRVPHHLTLGKLLDCSVPLSQVKTGLALNNSTHFKEWWWTWVWCLAQCRSPPFLAAYRWSQPTQGRANTQLELSSPRGLSS